MLLPLSGENLHDVANLSAEARLTSALAGFGYLAKVHFLNNLHRGGTKTRAFRNVVFRTKTKKEEVQSLEVLEVENGSFTPLVSALTGGMGRECKTFISKLAEKIAAKRNLNTSLQ